jgi:hypothetical protein
MVAAELTDGAQPSAESAVADLVALRAEDVGDEELRTKMLWGLCLTFVRYMLARFKARLVLLNESVDWLALLSA